VTDGCRLHGGAGCGGGDSGGARVSPPERFSLDLSDAARDRRIARLLVAHELAARARHRVAWTGVEIDGEVRRVGGLELVPFDVLYAGWVSSPGLPAVGKLRLEVQPLPDAECEWLPVEVVHVRGVGVAE